MAQDYDRSGLTYLLIDFSSDRFSDYLRKASQEIIVPAKFDDNRLDISYISAPYYRDPNSSTITGVSAYRSRIKQKLIEEGFQNKLLKYWWGIENDGSYTAKKIQERGMYNATDLDVSKADASKIGRAKLGDAGEKLIGNSYILTYEFRNVKTMKEIYDAKDAAARKKAEKNDEEFKPVRRTKNGFKGDIVAYLYRLSYNDTIQAYFFNAFTDENTIDMQKLNNVYDAVSEPIKYVSYTTASCDGTQNNSRPNQLSKQQLFYKFVNDGVASAMASFGKKLEQFRVKTSIESTFPIRAKIGKKEGITTDRRFFVWEYYEDSKGRTKTKRKAIIRSRMVYDNRYDELGNTGTTNFYQVAGGKIREGMLVQERQDAGIGFGLGYFNYAEKGAFMIRGEYSLSQALGYFANTPLTAFKAFVDVSFQKDKDRIVNGTQYEKLNYTHATFGVAKEFYFARRFHFGGIAGFGLEQAAWKDTNDEDDIDDSGNFSTLFFTVGGKFGVNIGGTTELVATVMQNTPTGDVLEYDSEGELVNTYNGVNWNDPSFFEERKGISFDIALRILF